MSAPPRRCARRRTTGVELVLLVAIGTVAAVSLAVGEVPVPWRDVPAAALGGGPDDARFVVQTLRLPRAALAVLVGAAFGASGAVFQAITRNPIASPDIIGVTAGAACSAVFAIVVLSAPQSLVSLAALAGALTTALAIVALAGRNGTSPTRLVLVGIGMNAWLMAITGYLLTRSDVLDAQRATVWLTGSLAGQDRSAVRTMVVACTVLLPVLVARTRVLAVLQLGDDGARSLGLRVERARFTMIVLAVALAAIATSTAGPVAFVAFMAPSIARRLTDEPIAIVPSALVGGLLLALADLGARRAFAPVELPVGVLTGVIGAPHLVWLLLHRRRIDHGGRR